jgi:phage-related protein
MADSDNDLVSQIVVTGDAEAAKNIQNYADKGAASFDKLAASATKAGASIEKATDGIDKSTTSAQKSAAQLNAQSLDQFRANASRLGDAVDKLGDSFPRLAQAAGRFAQRMTAVAATVLAAGVGLAAVASKVAKAYDGQSDSQDKLVQNQIEANNAALSQEQAQINLESSLRKLNQQLATGAISYQQYSTSVRQLRQDYAEQQRVANEVAQAQQRVKEQNDALTKSLADRKAYQALIDTYGGPLLTSLVNLGRQVDTIKQQFLNAFGPAIGNLISKIGDILSKNSGVIAQFFDQAGAKINKLVTTNGPQLELFFNNVGKAAASIVNGLIDAAPAIIDFFNNTLVPLVNKVAKGFQLVADAVNLVFGTRLTGGSIFIVAVLAQLTGSLKFLFNIVKAGGLVFKSFWAVVGAGADLLAPLLGGGKLTQQFLNFGAAVTKTSNPIKLFFNIIKSGIPLIVTLAEIVGAALGVSFSVALPLVIALGAALIYLLTKVDWKAFGAAALDALTGLAAWLKKTWDNALAAANGIRGAWAALGNWFSEVGTTISTYISNIWQGAKDLASAAAQGIQDAWKTLVDWFNTAVSAIGGFFSTLWTNVVAGVATAIANVQGAWATVASWFQANIITPVASYFTKLWSDISDAVGTVVKAIEDTWAAIVSWFSSNVLSPIKDLFNNTITAIEDAWSSAVENIKGFFSGLYTAALQYLQPIIDLLNTVIGLNNQAGGAGDGGATARNGGQFAGGGRVNGAGTSTSDSIPAWLSNGEFVMRAKAVRTYGSAFMHAINQGKWRGFAAGGIARLATGGPSSPAAAHIAGNIAARTPGMQPLNLNLFGEQFNGLMMPEDVGRKLTKYAITKQTSSAGRKPTWVGGGRT